jgi:hypothetical protein
MDSVKPDHQNWHFDLAMTPISSGLGYFKQPAKLRQKITKSCNP